MITKKAQVWSLDLMTAMALFLVGIMIFFMYSMNQSGEAESKLEILFYEGRVIGNSLVSPGYPENWDSASVATIGLVDNGRINNTKLQILYDMINTENKYSATKNIINTEYDYYFFFEENMTSIGPNVDGIGKPGATRNNIEARNLIKTTRFVVYENATTPIYLYIWEE